MIVKRSQEEYIQNNGKHTLRWKKALRTMNKGAILIESLVAITLMAIFISSFASLSINAHTNTENTLRSQQAILLGQEGIQAINTLAFQNLPAPGSAGVINFTNNQWIFSPSSAPEILPNGMTRYIRILGINRDGQCNIIGAGGTQDTDSREIQSEMQWQDASGRAHTAIFRQLRTQWGNPTGSCFSPQGGMANNATIQVAQARWSRTGTHLLNITVTNTDTEEEIIIDTMVLTWNIAGEIRRIEINDTRVWSSTGPGTPLGTQVSGTVLDIQNARIDEHHTEEIDEIQFTRNMNGATITLTLTFTDGSSLTTGPFSP